METAHGVIDSSLFETIDGIGERDELAMELSEIFAWDIDFNTAIKRGDTFRVAVEKLYLDGELKRYGKVLAAEFVNAGRTLKAVRFEGRDGNAAYFEPSGKSAQEGFPEIAPAVHEDQFTFLPGSLPSRAAHHPGP